MPSRAPRSEAVSTNPHSADRGLVRRLVAGSHAAWQEFVAGYAALVRSSVRNVLATMGRPGDPAGIDDVTAEVFAALLQNDSAPLRAFQGRSSLATYLRVIAVRVAIRHSLRPRESLVDTVPDPADHRQQGPPQAAIRNEQRRLLAELIEELPDRQREMIRMYYFEGRTYQQISRRLGVPVGSIGPTLQRAERRLRERLEPQVSGPAAEESAGRT